MVQRVAKQRVALGVDHDGAVAVVDEAGRDPRLRDCLARAGGADDERVLAAGAPDRDVDGDALGLAADNQAAVGDPAPLLDVASLVGSAQGIEGSEPATGLGGQVGPGAQVIAMPARPTDRHRRDEDQRDDRRAMIDRPDPYARQQGGSAP
ncbi:MAG: hypothetical protein M3P44_07790 [Actinomycetota bacterium]|nr:hypothetical protein [Actinomycetota bacterium]